MAEKVKPSYLKNGKGEMKDILSRENGIRKVGRCERGRYIWEITSRFQGALNGTRVGMEYEIIGNEARRGGRLNFNDSENLDITS